MLPLPARRLFAGLALAVTSCGRSSGDLPLTTADSAAIRALDHSYVDAWLRDDTAAVLATLAPDAVLMPAGVGPLTTLEAIRAFWWPRDGSRTRITEYTTTIDEIAGSERLAYVRGTGHLRFQYVKDSVLLDQASDNMTLTVVAPGPDGRWRIRYRMWGPLAR